MRVLSEVGRMVARLGEAWEAGGWLASLAAVALEIALPGDRTKEAMATLAVLMLVDMGSALWAQTATGHKISSAKLGRTLTKLVGITVAVGVTAASLRLLPGFGSEAVEASVAGLVALAAFREALSVLENLITAGAPIPEGLVRLVRSKAEEA